MERFSTKNRLKDKQKNLKEYLDFVTKILPKNLTDYKKDELVKASCERYFEKIVEARIDIGFLVVKIKNFRIHSIEESVFKVLSEEKVLDEALSISLGNAKSRRNFIIRQYGGIDDEIVFSSLKKELIPDATKFLEKINLYGK